MVNGLSPTAHMKRIPAQREKNKTAARLKDDGLTHKEVGKLFGVGSERARQLVAKGRQERLNASVLPARAANVLWRNQIIEDRANPDPKRVAQSSRAELMLTPNCGSGTIADIRAWLSEYDLDLLP